MTSEHSPFEQRAVSALETYSRGRPVLPALDLGILAILVGQGFQGEKQAGPCVALLGFPARQFGKVFELCQESFLLGHFGLFALRICKHPTADRGDGENAGGNHGTPQFARLTGLALGGLPHPLALGFVSTACVVFGDAVADEFPIRRRDIFRCPSLRPVACKLQLAARQKAALVGLECRAGLTEPLAPHQELAILCQPFAEWRLTQQRLVGDLDDFGVVAGDPPAIPDQQAALGEAVDQRFCLIRNLVTRRHPPNELARRIDLSEVGNERGPRQRKLSLRVLRQLALCDALRECVLNGGVDHAFQAPELLVAGQAEFVVGGVVLVEMRQGEGEQRQGILSGDVLEQGIDELRVDLERVRLDEPRRPLDHGAVGALQHHVEGECILGQFGHARLGLELREGIRAHRHQCEHTWIGLQRAGQDRDEASGFVMAFFIEKLFALIDGDNNGRRRDRLADQPRYLRDVAQRREDSQQPVVGLLDELLDVGTAARQTQLANPIDELRECHRLQQRLRKPELAGHRRALRPDYRQRQPVSVVSLEPRPQSRAQEGRLARARRAQDDQHPFDAGANQTAHLVEAAHDLRVTSEEEGRVFLLQKCEPGVGPASRLQEETRRIEPGAFQAFLEPCVGGGIVDEIDPLLVREVERYQALIDPDQRDDDLLAHQSGGVDFRLAPARRDPLGRDQR